MERLFTICRSAAFFVSQLMRTERAKTSSSSWKAGNSSHFVQRESAQITLVLLLWSSWCGVKCEREFNMSSVCWRKQVLQLVVMETKCMMLTCFYKITCWKCSWDSIFSDRGSLSFTKTTEQYKNTIVCGGFGGLSVPCVSLWAGQLQSGG